MDGIEATAEFDRATGRFVVRVEVEPGRVAKSLRAELEREAVERLLERAAPHIDRLLPASRR